MATKSSIVEIVEIADDLMVVDVEPKLVNAMTQHGVPEEDPDEENILVSEILCKYFEKVNLEFVNNKGHQEMPLATKRN